MKADPFNNSILEFDSAGVIRRLACSALPDISVGMTWDDLLARVADGLTRAGLDALWQAVVQGRVAPDYWPDAVPFYDGVVAHLRPVEAGYILQLVQVGKLFALQMLLEQAALPSDSQVIRLGQHVFSGIDGPLTDSQVHGIDEILQYAEYLRLLLEQAVYQLPAIARSPIPLRLNELLTFKERDFAERRLATHLIKLHYQWSGAMVYCLPDLRRVILRALRTLLTDVTAESSVVLSDHVQEDTVRVEIVYHSPEPDFRVLTRLNPVVEVAPKLAIERVIASIQACINPVQGQVWAEPLNKPDATARVILILPRWKL
jgi:hypothetical protein